MLHSSPSRADRAVTFGPAGRAGVSALLFVPVAFGAYFSVVFLAAAVVWMVVLPVALYQIWQPARVERDALWPQAAPRALEAPRAADTSRHG